MNISVLDNVLEYFDNVYISDGVKILYLLMDWERFN